MLGGSSSINGMIFQRGNPLDYERWAADPGMESWDYAHCLPYFKRMETCLAGADDLARRRRAARSSSAARPTNPLFRAFFEAVQQAGYPLTDDVNGYRQEGFAAFDRNIYRGHRLSAARAYLHPVHGPPEPRGAHAARWSTACSSTGTRAVGVEVVATRRSVERIDAGEVILCGGAINSPQLLQLSGVGQRRRAARARRRRRSHDLPGGRREPPGPPRGLRPVREQAAGVGGAGDEVAQPPAGRRCSGCCSAAGPGATNHFEGGGFVRSNEDVAYPNLMFHFLPVAIRYDGSAPQGHGYQVHVGPMYSDARGSVKIVSTDPRTHPALRFNYLSTEQDRREWVEAVRCRARASSPSRRSTPSTAASSRRAPTVADRRGDARLGRRATPRRRCTRRARAGWGPARTR